MYTVSSKIQADRLRHEVNLKQFELTKISNALESATEAVHAMEEEAGDDHDLLKEIKSSDDYKTWHAYEVSLDSQKDSLEDEIKLLNEEMKNFNKGSQNGIKESTSFWCFGG